MDMSQFSLILNETQMKHQFSAGVCVWTPLFVSILSQRPFGAIKLIDGSQLKLLQLKPIEKKTRQFICVTIIIHFFFFWQRLQQTGLNLVGKSLSTHKIHLQNTCTWFLQFRCWSWQFSAYSKCGQCEHKNHRHLESHLYSVNLDIKKKRQKNAGLSQSVLKLSLST